MTSLFWWKHYLCVIRLWVYEIITSLLKELKLVHFLCVWVQRQWGILPKNSSFFNVGEWTINTNSSFCLSVKKLSLYFHYYWGIFYPSVFFVCFVFCSSGAYLIVIHPKSLTEIKRNLIENWRKNNPNWIETIITTWNLWWLTSAFSPHT